MELHLEVVLLSTIKRKKPWPRFCWLGMEKEAVFLLDDNRISEINMVSGRTKRKIPKLQPVVQRALTTAVSRNGMWLAGLLLSGDVFLWSKDRGCLKTINTAPPVSQMVTAAHERSVRLSLLVSGDGRRLLLTAVTGQVFLWECSDRQDLAGARDGVVRGSWRHIMPPETTALPSPQDKEASQNSIFAQGEAVGDCCLTAFVFTAGSLLTVSFLRICWEESSRLGSPAYSTHWVTQTYPLSELTPPCRPVRSRGALVPAFSPDGQVLAVAVNQRDPRATQVLFISTQNFVTVSSWLGGCGSKNLSIPSKYVRSYWVACMSWAPGGLYLACVLKRGSLLFLARLGGLLSLSTSGCSVELGPAHFLPLHPLVTCRWPAPSLPGDASPTSSCASVGDPLRQRYSAAWHPRLPYLLTSDGYTASVLRAAAAGASDGTALAGSLLKGCAEALERARAGLAPRGGPRTRLALESMPTLKLTAGWPEPEPEGGEGTPSTLPPFLRDEADAAAGATGLYSGSRFAGEEDSDDEGGQLPGARVEDRGRLEFASMFDTLHAQPDPLLDDLRDPRDPDEAREDDEDEEEGAGPVLDQLERAQRSLLTAWALGVSTGGGAPEERRGRLLRSAIRCAVRLAGLLLVAPPQAGGKLSDPGPSRIWPLLRNLYALLPWDAQRRGGGGSCLGVAVELTGQIIRLILSPLSDRPERSRPVAVSKTLSSALLFLRMAQRSLDLAYTLPKGAPLPPADVFSVPFLKEGRESGTSQNALLTGRRPSSRLLQLWRGLYVKTLQCQAGIPSRAGSAEGARIRGILCQIQRVLQEHGERLGDGPVLYRTTGEQHFLSGSYAESARVWRAELYAEKERGGPRQCVLETRFCLALLYGHLFQYQLGGALRLCERLARQLIPRAGLEEEGGVEPAEEAELASEAELPLEAELPAGVGPEAAGAVVRSFGRFMAAYFTNGPLSVLPPHSVGVLPPLHLPPDTASGQRPVPLSRSRVLAEVRRQQLSEAWTVDHALELLLRGGLLPEAGWLALRLGDWKTAASLGLAYSTYCSEQADFTRLKWRELCLPAELQPSSIFQDRLEQLLGVEAGDERGGVDGGGGAYQHFTDWVLEEDAELQASVQEVLRASAMARVDVLSRPLGRLTEAAKDLASRLSGLVPAGVYLPAPPLYCPQPASDTQASVGDVGVVSEGRSRQCISGLLQRALLLLRSANCALPAAQWYISTMQHRQRLLHKKLSQPLTPFPEGLKEFVTSRGFFSPGTNGEGYMDNVTAQVIACFREVCGLCWMLHVRDQLSVSCRKYQAARAQQALSQGGESVGFAGGGGGDVAQRCTDALLWACRLLPFSRFLKSEDLLQDLVLSLVSELAPVTMVADVLARVFPEEEESVQVSLREKYSSLLQRLRHCTLPVSEAEGAGSEREVMMTVLVQQRLAGRRQLQRQIARRLAPLKRHIWERAEEEEEERSFDRFSPSRSTLSDSGTVSPQSDVYRAATPADGQEAPACSVPQQRAQLWSETPDGGSRGKDPAGGGACSGAPPAVGSWEFELLDEEYPRFLELFLCYVLQRDGSSRDRDSALPLLSGFSPRLREAELHSLTFDVLTTLRRRQRGQQSAAGNRHGVSGPSPALQLPSPSPSPSNQSQALFRSATASGIQSTAPSDKPLGLFGLRQPIRISQVEGAWLGSDTGPSAAAQTPRADYKAPPLLELPGPPAARFRTLGRQLEWMLRWADRRVRVSHPAPRRTGVGTGAGAGATEGVVMRARASTAAVLAGLSELERRYNAALLETEQHCVPEVDLRAGPAQPEAERTAHTGYTASSGSPISLPPLESPDGEGSSEASELEEVEESYMGRAIQKCSQEGALHPDPETRPNEAQGSQDEAYGIPAESESESRREEDSFSPAGSASCISVRIRTLPRGPLRSHEQTLTLADLDSDREETEGGASHPASDEDTDPDPAPEPNAQAAPEIGPHPGPRVHSSPSEGATQSGRIPTAVPPLAPPDPFSQLVQDQIFRLVQFQQMSFVSLMQTVAASLPNLPPLNQSQYHIPTANLPQLNQAQYSIPTANLPQLNQGQYPIPTANLPQLNQGQYPIPTANLPPLHQAQYSIPTANLPQLNQGQYPIPTANLPQLNQSQYPIPTANLPPLHQGQYSIPPSDVPPLNQTRFPFPRANISQQPGAHFFHPAQPGPQNPSPPPVTALLQPAAEDPAERQRVHREQTQSPLTVAPQYPEPHPEEEEQGRVHPERDPGPVPPPLLLLELGAGEDPDEPEHAASVSPSSESLRLSDMGSVSEEVQGLPVHRAELNGIPAEREDYVLSSLRNGCITPVPHQGVPLLRAAGSSQASSSAVPPAHRGIKLLQLAPPPPPLPQAPALLPAVPAALLYSAAVPPHPREAFVSFREAGPAQRPFGIPQERVRVAPRRGSRAEGTGGGEAAPLTLILGPRPDGPAPPHGLPLLRFHPEPRLPAAVPQAPFSSCSTPLISAPVHPGPPVRPGPAGPLLKAPGLSSSIQLLQLEPERPSKVLLGRAAWAQEPGGGAAGVAVRRLLTGVTQPGPAHATLASSKRQKRRDEREQEGENRSVAKPEGFRISATEPERVEPPGPALEEDVVISNESISDVVSRALSTAAELHAFASTHKRPPALHDASTNTDSAPSAGVVWEDPAAVAAAACPGVLLNLRLPRRSESPDGVEPAPAADVNGAGRHFLNVVDLEDEDLLERLPRRQAPASPDRPASPPPPVSAHLPPLEAPGPDSAPSDLLDADWLAVDSMLDTQLEPSESPGAPAPAPVALAPALPLPVGPEALLPGEEPLWLPAEREPVGLRDSSGRSVGFRDEAERSYDGSAGVGETAHALDATVERSVKLADESLDLSESLAELLGGRVTFSSLLGLSDSQTHGLSRPGGLKNAQEEEERRELRTWMRKKQKEMLAEYRRQREERREREHRPFTPSSSQTLTSRDLSAIKKMKEQKGKTLLLEHHTQRAREACSLITELLTPAPALSTYTKAPPPQSTNRSSRYKAFLSQSTNQSSRYKASLSQSTNQRIRRSKAPLSQSTNQSIRSRAAPHGFGRPEAGRRARSAPSRVSAAPRRTLGPWSAAATSGEHRPAGLRPYRAADALPDARLTRRGMQDVRGSRVGKGWGKGMGLSLREGQRRGETDLREEEEEESEEEEERVLSPWDPPPEIRRLLGLEEQASVGEGAEPAVGGAGLWLKSLERDSLSESTGSILSKLDWAAIEKMVAGEDEV